MTTPRVRIITGKGGVGKTTLATALAVYAASKGKRVLLAECDAGDRVSQTLGIPPNGFELREVRPNLFITDMNPRDAIREYAILKMRFEAVYRAVFENRVVGSFIRLVPSLGELVLLGKIWYHEQETLSNGRPKYDLIIVDAPSTGHAISMLRSPAAVARVVPPGPFRENCRVSADMLSDPNRTQLHVVVTPEEMPVNEAVELEQAARDVIDIALGQTLINMFVAPLNNDVLTTIKSATGENLAAAHILLEARQRRSLQGAKHLARLPSHMLQNSTYINKIVPFIGGIEQLTQIGETLLHEEAP